MTRLASRASAQVRILIEHYTNLGRDEAVILLEDAVERALAEFPNSPPRRLRAFPATYRELARYRLKWCKFHRYWMGATVEGGEWVITTVVYDAADIPSRLSTDTG